MGAWIFLAFCILLIAVGFRFVVQASKAKRDLMKYEFNNRTDGGVVRFADHEASLAHGRKHIFMGWLLKAGAFMVGIGAILIPFALIGIFSA